MRKKVILITGACGEIGHALVDYLIENSELPIVTLDLQDASPEIVDKVIHVKGNVTDKSLFDRLISEYEFDIIYHLAALLSTSAEFNPVAAHNVNVQGTLMLLEMAAAKEPIETPGGSVPIDHFFNVKGVGAVILGTVVSGEIWNGQKGLPVGILSMNDHNATEQVGTPLGGELCVWV